MSRKSIKIALCIYTNQSVGKELNPMCKCDLATPWFCLRVDRPLILGLTSQDTDHLKTLARLFDLFSALVHFTGHFTKIYYCCKY